MLAGINVVSLSAPTIALGAFFIVLLLWLYIYHASTLKQSKYRRMDELQDTLYAYSRLAGQLTLGLEREGLPGEPFHGALILALQESKSAPCLHPHIQEQIQGCLDERDESRLELLQRSLDREMARLAAERNQLLSALHSPSWGQALWQIVQPLFAPLAAAGIAFLVYQFIMEIDRSLEPLSVYEWVAVSARFVSGLVTTAYIYILALSKPRTATGFTNIILSILIVLAALFHLLGLYIAPYALGVQLLLFLLGFRLSKPPSRKERPYVGHPDLKSGRPVLHHAEVQAEQSEEKEIDKGTE
ncbi:hypothetical protein [Paenibacillus sp. Marseille-Q4541]|uniref:hypothetical protein n=1 Tax=Paenibacillus sp. Marseille-Q4541 TaxID=2831522 RepID=UPI001BA85A98|nr:hypothetical protein [Paenibacillus sp. Marseille-Q4541]